RLVLTAASCSPGRTGPFSHRRPAGVSGPLGLTSPVSQDLIPASGDQDHATLPSASILARRAMPKRPSHPAPNVRDDAYAPLCGRDARRGTTDLPDGTRGVFCEQWVKGQIGLRSLAKLVFARDGIHAR